MVNLPHTTEGTLDARLTVEVTNALHNRTELEFWRWLLQHIKTSVVVRVICCTTGLVLFAPWAIVSTWVNSQ